MPDVTLALAISSFIAGLLMFLAPCTLPLVPAYLAFISGVDPNEVNDKKARRKIIFGAATFIIGFTLIFVSFGVLAGLFGQFIGPLRGFLTQLGGIFIILFGFMMLGVIRLDVLMKDHKFTVPSMIVPGHPTGSFLMGAFFALGWTPCVGPVLASILILSTSAATVFSSALLLLIFSAGLAIPFMLTAVLYRAASKNIQKYSYVSSIINKVGGLFLIFIGLLLLSDHYGLMVEYGYSLYYQLGIDSLFEHY